MPEISFVNFLILFGWSVAAAWLYGFVWTWLQNQRPLKPDKIEKTANPPFVSILVPARNEAGRVLEKSISSMLDQTYEDYEVIVLNDRSTDTTGAILEKLNDSKLKIINGKEIENGWLGKPHALQQAFKQARGEWILTTDADIIFASDTLQTVINYAEKNNFDALTLIPKHLLGSFAEILFMPVFSWFCLLAMPLHRVNDPKRKTSMGVGNFFLFRREVLEKIGAFEIVKNEVVEDLKLAEVLKKKGFRLRIDYAPELIKTRMYTSFAEIWEGFTKNLFSGMKFSLFNTIFGAFWIFLLGTLPFFLAVSTLAFGSFWLFLPFFLAYILQVLVFVFVRFKFAGNPFYAFLTPFGFLMFLAILANSTIKVLSGKGVSWKGRAIYEQGGIRPPVN